MEGLGKRAKIFNQDSASPGRDLKAGPSEHEADVLTERSSFEVDGYEISDNVIT
jgi:hypothetical protein